MAKKPILVVMAAGMGSRYGGLKQIDPVGNHGETILDFSLYDAHCAGFEKAVIIIKKAIYEDFMATVGKRLEACPMEIVYAFQELTSVPQGFEVPAERVKPLGTGHAILCAAEAIGDAPFVVVNADDYYGQSAFRTIYNALLQTQPDSILRFCMVGYYLRNTLSENGGVARGVCSVNENGELTALRECIGIEARGDHAEYRNDDGSIGTLALDTLVSMNMFGFVPGILDALAKDFRSFLAEQLPKNPLKAEFFLPSVVSDLMASGKATVRVLSSDDRWYGVTYAEDKPIVVDALANLTAQGAYPDGLWA